MVVETDARSCSSTHGHRDEVAAAAPPQHGFTKKTSGNLAVTEWSSAGPLGRKETRSGNQRAAAPLPSSFLAGAV